MDSDRTHILSQIRSAGVVGAGGHEGELARSRILLLLPQPCSPQLVKQANRANGVGGVFLTYLRAGSRIHPKRPGGVAFVAGAHVFGQGIRAAKRCLQVLILEGDLIE